MEKGFTRQIIERNGTRAPAHSSGSRGAPDALFPAGEGRGEGARVGEYFQPVASLGRSLSDENRLRILQCIESGRRSVTSIAEELHLSQPLVSHHLRGLKRSLLVKIERSGPFIYYELSDPRILDIIQSLSTLARDLLSAGDSC